MKKISILISSVFLISSSAFAAPCDLIVNKLTAAFADSGQLVRIVTTNTFPNNEVTYTRGYLSTSDDNEAVFVSDSGRYLNNSADQVNAPFTRATADNVALKLTPNPGNNSVQVNYIVVDDPTRSIGYLASCRGELLYTLASDSIFTVSFRFTRTN